MPTSTSTPLSLSIAPAEPIPANVADPLRVIQAHYGARPLLVLIQDGIPHFGMMDAKLYQAVRQDVLMNVPPGTKPVVVLHSGGGYAKPAYQIARFLQRHCGGYEVIVPALAKSAATLFCLGADSIILGSDAEMGPLDAQVSDPDREASMSALEVVQCLERLNSEAIQAVDAHMIHWTNRCRKKLDTLLPIGTRFVADMMKPLFEKVDAVHLTSMSRVLRVAQDYAERLLTPTYGTRVAIDIASQLTEAYSEHDFVIDSTEAKEIGLAVATPDPKIADAVDHLSLVLGQGSLVGQSSLIGRIQ